jgi:hypothetical protein
MWSTDATCTEPKPPAELGEAASRVRLLAAPSTRKAQRYCRATVRSQAEACNAQLRWYEPQPIAATKGVPSTRRLCRQTRQTVFIACTALRAVVSAYWAEHAPVMALYREEPSAKRSPAGACSLVLQGALRHQRGGGVRLHLWWSQRQFDPGLTESPSVGQQASREPAAVGRRWTFANAEAEPHFSIWDAAHGGCCLLYIQERSCTTAYRVAATRYITTWGFVASTGPHPGSRD